MSTIMTYAAVPIALSPWFPREAVPPVSGIHCWRDLEKAPLETLVRHFGKAGEHYHRIARGIDERPVNPDRPRKSWGAETTFPADLSDTTEMRAHLVTLAEAAFGKLARQGHQATGVTVKVRYADFELVSRARTPPRPFREFREVLPHLDELLGKTEAGARKVRLLGVSFAVAAEAPERAEGQLDLFAPD